MSFLRHRQIYQSDVTSNRRRCRFRLRPRTHRLDEFAASYSLTGCTPALPASASPAGSILRQPAKTVNRSLREVGDFSTGTVRNFQPVLTRIMTSYGNGYQVTRNPAYMTLIQTAAQTMSTLYQPGAGVINSWPYYSGTKTTVIIDDMMTLELLFYAAQNGGSSAWYNMAVSHALQTMTNNVRPDGSTYQGVEYNSDGTVYLKFTADGYSVNSTWSRGQAWGIYGFTMAYRYTQDPRFLATAQLLANYYINNVPPDYVPYWDFSQTSPAPRDSSAAAIAAAGMLELSTYMTDPALQSKYYNEALNIQSSLSNPALYLANPSVSPTDGILLHGTYSVPSNVGVDTSLIWGDYYFLQSCYRSMSRPAQIMNLSATTPASSQVILTWDALSRAIRYAVKRSALPGGPYTIIAPPPVLTASTFTDTSVAPYTTYYYVVSATSVAGVGQDSAEVVVTTPASTPTTAALRSSLNPSTYGQAVTFIATVTSAASTPAGTVTFMDGAAALGTGTLNTSGQTSFVTSNLPAGSHSITAVYAGGSGLAASTSPPVMQLVNKAGTSTAISSSVNPSASGQTVKFSANISPSSAMGTVQFFDGSNSLATATLSGGLASLSTSALAVGPHSLIAGYNGDNNYNGSNSATLTQTVNPASDLPGAPGAPTFTNISSTSLTVNWTAASGATSYAVWRKPGTNGKWSEIGSTTTTLSFNDTGLTAGTLYTYEVIAWNATG